MTWTRARRWALTLMTCALMIPASAQAAGTGVITGTVTTPGGVSSTGICVRAYEADTQTSVSTTVSGGTYRLENLIDGEWTVQTETSASCGGTTLPSRLFTTWVTNGDTVTENIRIPFGATVSGVVTLAGGRSPAGICVQVLPYEEFDIVETTVAANGSYSLANVGPGDARVSFYTGMGCEGATTEIPLKHYQVTLDPQATTTVNAALDVASRISGTLTPPPGAGAGWMACIYLMPAGPLPAYMGSWDPIGVTYTDTSGNYDFPGVAAGSYSLVAVTCGRGVVAGRTLRDGVTTTTGALTANVDMTLPGAGEIQGSVVWGATKEICLDARSQEQPNLPNAIAGTPTQGATSNSFALEELAPGTYTVNVWADAACDDPYAHTPIRTIRDVRVQAGGIATMADIDLTPPRAATAPAPGTTTPTQKPAPSARPKDPCAGKKTAALAVCRAKIIQDTSLAACAKRSGPTRVVCEATARATLAHTQATERAKGTLVTDRAACATRAGTAKRRCLAAATATHRKATALADADRDRQVATARCDVKPASEKTACLARVKKAHASAVRRATPARGTRR